MVMKNVLSSTSTAVGPVLGLGLGLVVVALVFASCTQPDETSEAANGAGETASTADGEAEADGVSEPDSAGATTVTTAPSATSGTSGTTTTTAEESDSTDAAGPEDQPATSDPAAFCTDDLPSDPVEEGGYRRMELCGWQVFMHNDLFDDQLAPQVYLELREDMRMVLEVVPAPSVEFLQGTNIWLELDEPSAPGAVYHPSAQWLSENGYPTKWAQGVQFGNARNFLDWSEQQPAMLLHELTHALHDQRYGFDNQAVLDGYFRAMDAGLYDSVEYVTGGFQQAYATSNQQEYLAEISEAYFWTNDFFPFDRQDLADHDPDGLALVEQIWEIS